MTDGWHCAAWSGELAAGPLGRKLLGRDVVVFRDATGTARALGARCPHRGADLARGSVVAGCIQCPFHGWRFDGAGQCVRVPSQPATDKIPKLAQGPSFPVEEYRGTLWIWMGGGEARRRELPREVPGERRPARRLFFDPELVDAPLIVALENAFDQAHVPFIHRATFGGDQEPLVPRQRITVDPDGRGLRVEDDPASPWHPAPRLPRGWIGWIARLLGLRPPVAGYRRFDVEGATQQLYLEYPGGTYDLFLARFTPADAEHTWLFLESVRTRAPHAVGDWIQRRAIRRILDEGRLETQLVLPADPDDRARRVSTESDRAGLAVRQLYERWGAGCAAA